MADARVLSEADRQVVQTWIDWSRAQREGDPAGRRAELEEGIAPEVYVARTPAAGIPALVAGTGGAPDKPGVASCPISRVLGTSTKPELQAVSGLNRTVHNLTTAAIPGDGWVLVARDKFGTWVAVQGGGGAAEPTGVVRLTTTRVDGYYVSRLGTGTFNTATKTFPTSREVYVLDAAEATIPG